MTHTTPHTTVHPVSSGGLAARSTAERFGTVSRRTERGL